MHLAARITMSWLRARSLGRGHVLPSPGNRGIVKLLTRTASAASDLPAGIFCVYRFPFRPVMHTEKTGHFAPHGVTPHRWSRSAGANLDRLWSTLRRFQKLRRASL